MTLDAGTVAAIDGRLQSLKEGKAAAKPKAPSKPRKRKAAGPPPSDGNSSSEKKAAVAGEDGVPTPQAVSKRYCVCRTPDPANCDLACAHNACEFGGRVHCAHALMCSGANGLKFCPCCYAVLTRQAGAGV